MSADEVVQGVTARREATCEECYLPELTVMREGENRYIECLACGHYEAIPKRTEVPA